MEEEDIEDEELISKIKELVCRTKKKASGTKTTWSKHMKRLKAEFPIYEMAINMVKDGTFDEVLGNEKNREKFKKVGIIVKNFKSNSSSKYFRTKIETTFDHFEALYGKDIKVKNIGECISKVDLTSVEKEIQYWREPIYNLGERACTNGVCFFEKHYKSHFKSPGFKLRCYRYFSQCIYCYMIHVVEFYYNIRLLHRCGRRAVFLLNKYRYCVSGKGDLKWEYMLESEYEKDDFHGLFGPYPDIVMGMFNKALFVYDGKESKRGVYFKSCCLNKKEL